MIAVFCLCYLSFPDVIVHIVSKLSFYIFQFWSVPHFVGGFFPLILRRVWILSFLYLFWFAIHINEYCFSLYQHVFLLYAINYCHEVVYFVCIIAASRLFYILHHLGLPGFRFFKEILFLNYLYTVMLTSFFPQLKVISLPEDSRYRPLKPVSFTWSFWSKLS